MKDDVTQDRKSNLLRIHSIRHSLFSFVCAFYILAQELAKKMILKPFQTIIF